MPLKSQIRRSGLLHQFKINIFGIANKMRSFNETISLIGIKSDRNILASSFTYEFYYMNVAFNISASPDLDRFDALLDKFIGAVNDIDVFHYSDGNTCHDLLPVSSQHLVQRNTGFL